MNRQQRELRSCAVRVRSEPLDDKTRGTIARALDALAMLHGMLSDTEFDADLLGRIGVMLNNQGLPLFGMDTELTADELEDKYSAAPGHGDHPTYTHGEWRAEVAREETWLGYWDWVENQITHAVRRADDD